jgi:hypothetical protein
MSHLESLFYVIFFKKKKSILTIQSLTVTIDFHVNIINKNIKELSHTNTCILRY